MKHQIPVIIAAIGLISGIAAARNSCGNTILMISLYCICILFLFVALVAAWYEGLPKPHIVVTGFGNSGHGVSGVLIRNDGEPAYNIHAPSPLAMSQAQVMFETTHRQLRKEDGDARLLVTVRTSLGDATNSLYHDMALRDVPELAFSFEYADGSNPNSLRYRSHGMIRLLEGRITAEFAGWKFLWSRLFWRE